MQPDFKQQTLAEVNEDLIETWKEIRNMYTAPALQACLDIYSANTGLVEWLKEATSGVCIFVMHKFCIATVLYSTFTCTLYSVLMGQLRVQGS